MDSWLAPPVDYVKLNADKSALGNPEDVSFGGILRDEHGRPILGFLGFIGGVAELCAIRHGLILTWNRGY